MGKQTADRVTGTVVSLDFGDRVSCSLGFLVVHAYKEKQLLFTYIL